jgi:dTDP-4-dehydrorhamnose 3,5-epimerase
MPFEFQKTEIDGVTLITPRVFSDPRGQFLETYRRKDFEEHGILGEFVQDNHSVTTVKGVVRGLHYQKGEFAQAKLVRCLEGEIFDVAVDLRPASPTYGKFVSALLSGENHRMLYVPRGFAHGFQTLTEKTQVTYKVDNGYAPQAEAGLLYNDSELGIPWPVKDAVLLPKDFAWPTLSQL